jgi:hypothetical protein
MAETLRRKSKRLASRSAQTIASTLGKARIEAKLPRGFAGERAAGGAIGKQLESNRQAASKAGRAAQA